MSNRKIFTESHVPRKGVSIQNIKRALTTEQQQQTKIPLEKWAEGS